MRTAKSKWFLPLLSVALGVLIFAAAWLGAIAGLAYLAAVVTLRIRS